MNKPAVTKIITDPDKNIQVVKTDLYNNDLNNIKDGVEFRRRSE